MRQSQSRQPSRETPPLSSTEFSPGTEIVESIDKALFIKQPWIDLILSGETTWEIRGSNLKHRGPLALIESGSGTVVGVVNVTDAIPLSLRQLQKNSDKAGFYAEQPPYKNTHAWVLSDPIRLEEPLPYHHKPGVVTFIGLDEGLSEKLASIWNRIQSQ
jgi:hypothetical protein